MEAFKTYLNNLWKCEFKKQSTETQVDNWDLFPKIYMHAKDTRYDAYLPRASSIFISEIKQSVSIIYSIVRSIMSLLNGTTATGTAGLTLS